MITWEQAHLQAGIEAANLHGKLDIDPDLPIDVFAAVERLGIVLAFAPMDNCSGVYIPAEVPGSLPGILVHQGHPLSRQRFTAGHELGHHVFGHEFEIDTDLEQRFFRGAFDTAPDQEKQAEAFATWFLMPRRLLRSGIRRLELSLAEPAEVYALSLWLGTSYQATVRQLATTRILAPQTANDWSGIRPRTIKVGLLGEESTTGDGAINLRRDVWWIDHTTLSNSISVRPGDRLIVRLPENASTGYSWRPRSLSAGLRVISDSFEDHWEPSRGEPATPPDGLDAGETTMRSLQVSIESDTPTSVQQMSFEMVQPWSEEPVVDTYEIFLSVTQSPSGLQMASGELAVDA